MSFYDVFVGIEETPLGQTIKESNWMFPAIEAVHLLALATLGGAVLLLDLRLVGIGLTAYPPSTVEKGVRPWLTWAVVVLIASGLLIGASETLKLWGKPSFWIKMTALVAAILFTWLVRNPAARRDATGMGAVGVGLVSMALWLTVAVAGRWIGFS